MVERKRGWIATLLIATTTIVLLYVFVVASSGQPPPQPAPVEEENNGNLLNLIAILIIIGCIALMIYWQFQKGEQKSNTGEKSNRGGIDNQLVIYAGIFITAIVGFVFAGMTMVLLIGGAGGIYLLWKYFAGQKTEGGMITYEIADDIAKLQRFHGMRLRTEQENIAGLYLPALELHLVSFIFENLVFQKLKNGMIVGPDIGSLHAVLDRITNTQNLFSAPTAQREVDKGGSEEED